MTLLQQIQESAIDGSSDLETLLRKCRVLAARLQNDEFKNWVQSELDGYRGDIDLPDYRHFRCQAFGHFSGAFGRQLKNAQIPDSCIPEELRDMLTTVDMRESVSALVDLIKDCEGAYLQSNWPADAYRLFGTQIYQDMNLMQAWIAIPKSAVITIVSTVRNRILNFVLEIEATNPEAGEAEPGSHPIPEDRVQQIFNNYIYGNVGSMASGRDISQITQQNVNAGDFESLATFLKDIGFGDADITELKESLEVEKAPQKSGFGPKVATWLGKAVGKIAQGGMKISTSAASEVLGEAIKNYYGL
jgi:hypothetical protein